MDIRTILKFDEIRADKKTKNESDTITIIDSRGMMLLYLVHRYFLWGLGESRKYGHARAWRAERV